MLTVLLKTTDYNGAGTGKIIEAISGNAKPYDFLLKILFTAITVSGGFKGGEIVPSFFVGATFGAFLGVYLGVDAGFLASLGMISVFSVVVNCPLASLLMSVELFGVCGAAFFFISIIISWLLGRKFGIYYRLKK